MICFIFYWILCYFAFNFVYQIYIYVFYDTQCLREPFKQSYASWKIFSGLRYCIMSSFGCSSIWFLLPPRRPSIYSKILRFQPLPIVYIPMFQLWLRSYVDAIVVCIHTIMFLFLTEYIDLHKWNTFIVILFQYITRFSFINGIDFYVEKTDLPSQCKFNPLTSVMHNLQICIYNSIPPLIYQRYLYSNKQANEETLPSNIPDRVL